MCVCVCVCTCIHIRSRKKVKITFITNNHAPFHLCWKKKNFVTWLIKLNGALSVY